MEQLFTLVATYYLSSIRIMSVMDSVRFVPNYSAGVSVSIGTFKPSADGVIIAYQKHNSNKQLVIKVNNTEIFWLGQEGAYEQTKSGTLLVSKDDTYTLTGGATSIMFYPYKTN